jgi:spoIIIJ-associated protein
MSKNRTSLEIIAPTIEEAIDKGLTELGLSRDRVEVDILDEGNRGLFGIGTRQARIRLSILPLSEIDTTSNIGQESFPTLQEVEASDEIPKSIYAETEEAIELTPDQVNENESDDITNIVELSKATVQELLERMGIEAGVTTSISDQIDKRGRRPVLIEISGSDLSILIGRHTETLNALQYITTLIVGKELGQSVSLIIDVEGYRQRREQQLRQIARRMAEQAIKTGRRQVLEPMPANERRIVHIELRENPQVETESTGEDPRRKVTIIPK